MPLLPGSLRRCCGALVPFLGVLNGELPIEPEGGPNEDLDPLRSADNRLLRGLAYRALLHWLAVTDQLDWEVEA